MSTGNERPPPHRVGAARRHPRSNDRICRDPVDCRVASINLVRDSDARRETLRQRLRLDYRQVATTPSGKRFVVTASRRSLPGDSSLLFLPLPVLLGWAAVKQFFIVIRRQPRWKVEVFPAWEPSSTRIIVTASKAEAIRRADVEALTLTRGAT